MTLVWESGITLQHPDNNDPLLDLNTQPSLDLQFATSKTLDDAVSGTNLITFSRASSGTYVDSDGLIKTSPVNLLRYSEQFDQSAWIKTSGITLSSNVETAPDGNLTADGLTRTATNEFLYSASSVTGTLTLSCWVKVASGTATFFMQSFSGADGGQTSPTKTATTEWQRFELTVSTTVPSNFYPCLGAINTTFYIWGAQLQEGTTATDYIPTGATISGAPRFDHDPVTGESLGLLIEEERTNLLTYSEQFDQSAWAVGGTVSVVPNSALSPDGLMTADQITLGAVNSRIGQFNLITTTGQTGTASVYLKNIDHVGVLTLRTGLAGGAAYNLNLSLTNEWVRYELTTTHNGTQNVEFHIRETDATPSGSFLMWGAQLEVGSFPTSYIPTSGSTVTRSPDLATIEGTNFSSWYNQSEGTVFIKGSTSDIDANTGWSSFFQASSPNNNRISIRQGQTIITSAGTGVTLTNSASPTVNETEEIAFAYKENDFAQYTSYANPAFQGTGLTPVSVDTLLIASVEGSGSVFNLNGHITRLAYYPYRLADATLQEITS